MSKVSSPNSDQEETLTNSDSSFVQEKTDESSPSLAYESAIQDNKLDLDKDERYDTPYHSRPVSVDTSSTVEGEEDGAVMESGFRGYLIVLGCFLTLMTAIGYALMYGIFQSHYTDIYAAQGAAASSVSIVGSLAVGFQFGFCIIAGPVMNRFGYKVVLWSGSIIGSLGLLLASWGTKLWHLYLTQGVMFGIGVSLLNLAATAIPPLWFEKRPFASIVMRAPRQLSGPPIEVRKDAINLQILKNPRFILLFISTAFFGFGYMIPFTYIPSYAKDIVSLDPNIQGAHLISIMSAANAVGLITVGFAADYIGAIRVTAFIFVAAGASCFVWMFSHSYGALLGFSILYGLFSGGFFILVASIIANIIGLANLGSGLTIIFLFNTPGNLVTLPIAGKMVESAGGYRTMIGYNAAMYFSAALFLCILMLYNHHTSRVNAA
ncbi:hypothetical protein BX616_010590 [Lobosporangium transversale]|uniref:Major facilitator superfamily domain-containing protein n=1 Tax=Lobosporangium transversale TaxID=64571 RepID=A0A1Y2GRI2_9FUNG|nr:major facilitator superfamily domain-containing protein [Lobosporangium transversale]KAF9911402.1 hypothetical protein BX616_010590 [Lobosporangium transversale]ORZ17494.1 major facilitator superfamily domain-containing protein [Lobosporangium transversale]|eukprot:XP_021881881.1 major facilitator superfamily domain-containing protein [Lobosporangium transversale]